MIKKTPKWIWLISIAFIVMQYLICLNVYMMGDDYMYGTFGHQGIFSSVFSYYFTGNGRWLVNILDSLCLFCDRYLYVVVNPWLLLLLGILLYRFISQINGKSKPLIFAASLVSISVVSVMITCEVFYWITGVMNYLVPSLFLLASMTAVLKMRADELSSKQKFACSLVCILSCLMMEQYGLMTIGWMFLIWGWDLIKSKKFNKTHVVVFFTSLVGLSTIVFAPANTIRFDDAAAKNNSIVTKFIDLIYYDYCSEVSATLVFVIAAYFGYVLFREKKYKLSILSCTNAVILLLMFDYKLLGFSGGVLMLFALISILISLTTIVPRIISLYRKKDIINIIALFIIGIGSQIMLLKTDLWGFRTSFSWIILYLIVILMLVADKADMKSFTVFVCIVFIAINPYVGLLGVTILVVAYYYNKTIPTLAVIVSLFVIIVGLSDEAVGYRENSQIHKQNIAAAESAEKNDKIEIQDYEDEQYGWNSPPFSEFHESYFRNYYNIPDDVLIKYVGCE